MPGGNASGGIMLTGRKVFMQHGLIIQRLHFNFRGNQIPELGQNIISYMTKKQYYKKYISEINP